MEIQFYGANCIRIAYKKAVVVIDDNLESLGASAVTKDGDIFVRTHGDFKPKKAPKIIIDRPGEYEVSDISIKAIEARAHMDEPKKKSATIFKFDIADIRVVVAGHIFADLAESQLETIGTVDVLIVPVGNHGYTLDAIGASKVIKAFEPKIVIPTHYEDKDLSYEVPQSALADAIKDLPFEMKEAVPKLKLKSSSDFPEIPEIVILERQ